MIPYGRQNVTDEDINEVVAVLKSDYLTQGPKLQNLKRNLPKLLGLTTLLPLIALRVHYTWHVWR